MKKIKLIPILVLIILIFGIISLSIVKNNQNYIILDGTVLALTLDGKPITTLPERNAYNIQVDCGDAAYGKWLAEEWMLVLENITDNVTCNINFTSKPNTLKKVIETVNANQNYDGNGYRYSGKNPNNWIWFNGEKWRIIGSIPTCTSSNCATQENLVKIIRNESIGSYVYDASSITYSELNTSWGSNTLYSLLNTHYYASDASALNGQNHAGCYYNYFDENPTSQNCDYTETGILSSSYYGKMVKNVYWNTGNSYINITAESSYVNETSKQTLAGYVGLMNVSDYGYAADEKYHSISIDSYSSNFNNATSTNWLCNIASQWTNIIEVEDLGDAPVPPGYVPAEKIVVISLGSGATYYGNSAAEVRPVIYLDSSVYIVSGDGTEGNPYQIGM